MCSGTDFELDFPLKGVKDRKLSGLSFSDKLSASFLFDPDGHKKHLWHHKKHHHIHHPSWLIHPISLLFVLHLRLFAHLLQNSDHKSGMLNSICTNNPRSRFV
jgi:hypothetical protein